MASNDMEPSSLEPSEMETRTMETDPPTTPLTTSTPQDSVTRKTQDTVSKPVRPRGPNTSPIVLGLVAMLLAGLVIAQETRRIQVDWSRMGPGTIVGIGVVMVVIGAIGLARRRDNV